MPPAPLPPRYRDPIQVAAGGFGVVLRAHDTQLGRDVAIKRLHATGATDPEVAARFLREARRTAAIQHPHLIQVLDLGQDQAGDPYLVYEWVEGADLASLPTPPRPAQLRHIGAAIADAIHALHQTGVVHRDVKPANVMLRADGHPLLADLGIAQVAGGATVQTAEGMILGTPAYMAPELWRGEPASSASDQWAWAGSLLVVAGGPLPWGTSDPAAIAEASRSPSRGPTPPLPPGGLDPTLDDALRRALDPDPQRRFPDLAAFADALRAPGVQAAAAPRQAPTQRLASAASTGAPPLAPATPTTPPGTTSRRAAYGRAAIAGLAAMALGALLVPEASRRRPAAPADPADPADSADSTAPSPRSAPAEALLALEDAAGRWSRALPEDLDEPGRLHRLMEQDPTLVLRWRRLLRVMVAALPVPGGPEALSKVAVTSLAPFLEQIAEARGRSTTDPTIVGRVHERSRLPAQEQELLAATLEFLRDLEGRGAALQGDRRQLGGHLPYVGYVASILCSYLPMESLTVDPDQLRYMDVRRHYLGRYLEWWPRATAPWQRVLLALGATRLMDAVVRSDRVSPEQWTELLGHLGEFCSASLPEQHAYSQVRVASLLARSSIRGTRQVPGMATSPATRQALAAALGRLEAAGPDAAKPRAQLARWAAARSADDRYDFSPELRAQIDRALPWARP